MTTYILKLRPTPDDDRPPVLRLRRSLKVLLRSFGLRCIELREEPDNSESTRTTIDDQTAGPTI